MSKQFGKRWKDGRTAQRMTLREVSEALGLSVSYLSDIEQGRRSAPDLETVHRYEQLVNITDRSLVSLAQSLRSKLPANLIESLKTRPLLADLLFRYEELTDEELQKKVNELAPKEQ